MGTSCTDTGALGMRISGLDKALTLGTSLKISKMTLISSLLGGSSHTTSSGSAILNMRADVECLSCVVLRAGGRSRTTPPISRTATTLDSRVLIAHLLKLRRKFWKRRHAIFRDAPMTFNIFLIALVRVNRYITM